jgi:hypothetical protein
MKYIEMKNKIDELTSENERLQKSSTLVEKLSNE